MEKPQLFLLHFAGGNCYSYQFLRPYLREFDVVSLELPGRGKRINENLLKVFADAAADIYGQIKALQSSSTVLLYGHSMGAFLALKAAQMLENEGRPISYLIVSGNGGPRAKEGLLPKRRYLFEKEELKAELRDLGGIPPEMLENEELFDFFEPILRADFQLAENHGLINQPPVEVPIYAIMGNRELDLESLSQWRYYTHGKFDFEILEGDHFFIYRQASRLAEIFRSCLNSCSFKFLPKQPGIENEKN